ncbi:porin family protein [Dyadobacter sp. CY261]|uniref:porin family protein n=1 Tax=Dyadobacter sp. CY261 TaxID=2907203 RepID=UPI001F213084|nr:porin family protein [Dyadobacter sp. CY261]MCF0073224.1 porin family protein [Dyadobacter sp. CY261]
MLDHNASAQEASVTEWRKDRGTVSDSREKAAVREREAGEPEFSRWSFVLNGGYAYRLFRAGQITSHDEQEYLKDLKSGIAFGGDVAYFPWKHVGFGLRYEMYKGNANLDSSQSEKVTIQHLSGALIHRSFLSNGKTAILSSLLLGYQPYENKSTVGNQPLTFSGKTMNWGVSVGIEQPINNKFALNLTGTAMMGAIYRLQRKTAFSTETLHLSKDDSVDLSRFSLTLGFRFL